MNKKLQYKDISGLHEIHDDASTVGLHCKANKEVLTQFYRKQMRTQTGMRKVQKTDVVAKIG